MPEKALRALLSPDADDFKDKQDLLGATLRTWTKVGVIRDANDMLTLVPVIGAAPAALSFARELGDAVLSLLLADRPGLQYPTDFAKLTSWMLLQDPFAAAGWSDAQARGEAERQTPGLWQGDNILNSLRHWAVFTGLASSTPGGDLFVPARALRMRLDGLLPTGEPQPLATFMENASTMLPCLPGGKWSGPIRTQATEQVSARIDDVPATAALALKQLEQEGLLVLSDIRNDAAPRRRLLRADGAIWTEVSHVQRVSQGATL
jgi:hypothetical protein